MRALLCVLLLCALLCVVCFEGVVFCVAWRGVYYGLELRRTESRKDELMGFIGVFSLT